MSTAQCAFGPALLSAIPSVISAVLSLLVLIVYKNQLATMRQALAETRASNEIAARSLVLGRRSWLVVTKFEPPRLMNAGKFDLRSDLYIRNVGGVPALIQRYGCGFVVDNLPESLSLNREQSVSCAVFISSQEEKVLEHRGRESDPAAACDLQRPLYFWWVVEYSDCFEKTWRSTRCWRRTADGSDWEAVPGYSRLE